ncbi:Phosphoglucosamine mutase [archaeon HR05]|nr:Phosphoglucosamine mutase [archaeon HR05]
MGLKVSISGVRGLFPEDLTLEHVMNFTRVFSSMLSDRCALAMDTRISSKSIASVASAVLREYGIDVYNLGVAPTPVLVRESNASRVGAGIMVTASHNPLEWNGLKFALNGREVPADLLLKSSNSSKKSKSISRIGVEYWSSSSASSIYLDDLFRFLELDGYDAEGVRVAVDTAHGSSRAYILEILARLGFRAVVMDSIAVDPTGSDLAHLYTAVSNGCRLGIALDMDGDRAVVLTGQRYKPDDTLLICLAKAVEMGCRSIAVSIDTSNAVRDLARAMNCKLLYSKVGEANVVDTMLKNGCGAGGEGSSAGFIMAGFNLCRDGLLASALSLSMLDRLDEVMEYSKRYSVRRGKVDARGIKHDRISDLLLSRHDYSESITMDGIKLVLDESTWVLVRPSNTEDVVRLSVESESTDRCNELYRMYEQMIKDAG